MTPYPYLTSSWYAWPSPCSPWQIPDACFDEVLYPSPFGGDEVQLLPWWMRMPMGSQSHNREWYQSDGSPRGWFTDSYPDLYPYYPIPAASADWPYVWMGSAMSGYWWP